MRCSSCGEVIPANVRFCAICGTRQSSAVPIYRRQVLGGAVILMFLVIIGWQLLDWGPALEGRNATAHPTEVISSVATNMNDNATGRATASEINVTANKPSTTSAPQPTTASTRTAAPVLIPTSSITLPTCPTPVFYAATVLETTLNLVVQHEIQIRILPSKIERAYTL